MLDEEINKMWTEFVTDEKYKKYFNSATDDNELNLPVAKKK